MSKRMFAVSACAMMCLALFGCQTWQTQPVGTGKFVTPFARVAVVEFFDRSQYTGTADDFTDALREQLSGITAGTDFIAVRRSALPGFEDPFTGGTIPVASLAEARRTYKADAVVIGVVDNTSPYYKPSLSVTVKVVETGEGTVLCDFSQTWDANTSRGDRDIEAYYKQNLGCDDCRFGPDIFLISPRYFMKYAAHRAAEKIVAGM